jgi:hypothetical protein
MMTRLRAWRERVWPVMPEPLLETPREQLVIVNDADRHFSSGTHLLQQVRHFSGAYLVEVAANRRLKAQHQEEVRTLRVAQQAAEAIARQKDERLNELEARVAQHGKEVARLARRIMRRTRQ